MVISVEQEPYIELHRWHLIHHSGVGYRLVGTTKGRVRLSSPVVEIDERSMRVVTESGRVYRLMGDSDAQHAARVVRLHMIARGLPFSTLALADVEEIEALREVSSDAPRRGFH